MQHGHCMHTDDGLEGVRWGLLTCVTSVPGMHCGRRGERGVVRGGGDGARERCCAWEHGGTPTVQCRSPGAGARGWVRCPQDAEEESKTEEMKPPTSIF